MTTLVIVAMDDFAMHVESDDPAVPKRLLAMAEITQAALARQRPMMDQALQDAILFGRGVMSTGAVITMPPIPLKDFTR